VVDGCGNAILNWQDPARDLGAIERPLASVPLLAPLQVRSVESWIDGACKRSTSTSDQGALSPHVRSGLEVGCCRQWPATRRSSRLNPGVKEFREMVSNETREPFLQVAHLFPWARQPPRDRGTSLVTRLAARCVRSPAGPPGAGANRGEIVEARGRHRLALRIGRDVRPCQALDPIATEDREPGFSRVHDASSTKLGTRFPARAL
jgi:hypothetical protein